MELINDLRNKIYPIAYNISLTSHELFSLSTELVELKIEEFLASFGEMLNSLTEEAFNTQVCVCVCLFCVFVSFPLPKSFRNVKSCSTSYLVEPHIQICCFTFSNTRESQNSVEKLCALHVCVLYR